VIADPLEAAALRSDERVDDLSREVYCILGVPIDAVDMPAVVHKIERAATKSAPFLISTPNLHFLVNSQKDREFRDSLLQSDLCPTDGMPLLWIAKLMGIPIKRRIAGSDIFEALKRRNASRSPLRIFLFGSTDEVAAAASERLNETPSGLNCVGWSCPGFGTVEQLSHNQFIDEINSAQADFLVAALGAKKGQLWLQENHDRLRTPVRAHLGATINFQAGTVKRAPYGIQRLGLEWLWRIKEEPHLWRRYWHDGRVLLQLLLTRVLPLAIQTRWQRLRYEGSRDLIVKESHGHEVVTLRLYGTATAAHAGLAASHFRNAAESKKAIIVDLSETHAVDARFLGLLLMLHKQLKARAADLKIVGVRARIERAFRLNGAAFLLSSDKAA
jgi:N-acetylglucosaminyldiphosphoundecaprenol N-acetyl-beta-D-mannosaminyltransferase